MAVVVAVGLALPRGANHARTSLDMLCHAGSIGPEPMISGDDLVERAAVELHRRGLLNDSALTPNGTVELAATRSWDSPKAMPGVDARHEFLALSLQRSDTPRLHELALRLSKVGQGDPVVAAADALAQVLSRGTVPVGLSRALLARNPLDPLLAAVALRLAERAGDQEVATRARSALTALGPSPGDAATSD